MNNCSHNKNYLLPKEDRMNEKIIVNRIKEALGAGPKMVFFVGAGISVPSKVKKFQELSEDVIRAITKGKLQNDEYKLLSEIRPEVMLQTRIQELGSEVIESLEVLLDYKPNFNHFFLAEALRHGNWVFTTNQENLIEDACELIGSEYKRCYIDSHFENFEQHISNPKTLPGEYIFKLHGTIEENKKGKERFESIRIALEQVGKGLTDHSKKVFEYFLKNYDFCFMGYSCQDDFSVYPVLSNTNSDKTIFWVQYAGGEIKLVSKREMEDEIKKEMEKKPWKGEKRKWEIINVNNFLIRRGKFFKFVGDSSKFIEEEFRSVIGIHTDTDAPIKGIVSYNTFEQWVKNINEFKLNIFIGRLFEHIGEWGKAEKYYKEAIKVGEERRDGEQLVVAKRGLADLYTKQTELDKENKAIEIYKECIGIAKEHLKDDLTATILKFDIANVERRLGIYPENPKKWAEDMEEELLMLKDKDVKSYASYLNIVGLAHLRGSQDDIKVGLGYSDSSKNIKKDLGDKDGEAAAENAIGLLLIAQGRALAKQDRMLAKTKFNEAIKHLEKAIDIRIKYGFFRGCAQHSRNIGDAYRELMKFAQNRKEQHRYFRKAEENYEISLNYLDLIKPRAPIGEILNWRQRIAGLYRDFYKLIDNTEIKKKCISNVISVYKDDLNLLEDREMFREIKYKEKENKMAKNILKETKEFCEEIGLLLEAEEVKKLLEKLGSEMQEVEITKVIDDIY